MIEPFLSDEHLLADIAHRSRQIEPSRCQLWWLGQSGYFLNIAGTRVLIDPYLSDSLTEKYANTEKPHVRISRRVIDPALLPNVDLLTSSHNHTDHLDAETLLAVLARSRNATIVVPQANIELAADRLKLPKDRLIGINDGQTVRAHGVEIWAVPAAHPTLDPDEQGQLRHLGYVFRSAGWSIYHSGDTMVFEGMVDRLKPFNIDIAILPINGKVGNMDGAAAAELGHDIGARIVIPCHYDMFEFNTASPLGFQRSAKSLGVRTKTLRLGECFDGKELQK